ncbi:hypothetical protein [Paraburkholderia acidiphila]|uniref:Uncharacterized protein n=1 Tax=Paraburkholderia acidiphila TaxID=2571747 RepID=A0A7Z2G7X8_9BURK|nr:hypothetical protein [Paraburkholderia acidiphila]QGZ56726.1 hypothetical protein FAZ97_17325 [Paraburkholderia acidiphila]
MRAADLLRELGRPIAYYPFLARYLGGLSASVLFCQIFYWQDKATSELGVYKTVDDIEKETGLTYEEQRTARAKLRALGVLVETAKRIEHRTYFRIDEDALERILAGGPPERKPKKRKGESTSEKSTSPDGESPSREMGKDDLAKAEIPMPPDGETQARGEGDPHSVNRAESTAETTAAASRASDAVDNSVAAAAAADDDQTAGTTPLDVEARLTDLLIELEAERGKRLVIDRSRDRVHIVTWVGRQLTEAELRLAHARAAGARQRDKDKRALNVAYVACFVDEVLAERELDAQAAAGASAEPAAQWWLSDSGIGAQGKRVRVERRGPNEPTPDYLIRVAQASGRGPWIDYVLKREQGASRYQEIVAFFGDALLPPDF